MGCNAKVLIAFVAGQFVQVIAHLIAKTNYMQRPVLFCIAAGFLVFVAVLAGVILGKDDKPKKKSYKDYAVPERYD